MEPWLRAGRRIKADWSGMLDAMRSRSPEPAKLPFVPLRVSGRMIELVVRDGLKALLGPNPSLLTVVRQDGRATKAYAEDASSGIYETLTRLAFQPGAGRDALVELAREAGVEVGVVKEAEREFFELFEEEPEELLAALVLLVHGVSLSLREGWLGFTPELPLAAPVKALDLSILAWRFLLSRALPEGSYGLGMSCSGGSCALRAEVTREAWKAEEVEVAARSPGALARELVEEKGCGAALAVRLPDLAALIEGRLPPAEFIRGRGEKWDVATRSGLEALLGAAPWAAKLLDLEADLDECNVSLDSLIELARGYLASAKKYAREKGVGVRLTDAEESLELLWGSEGVRELESPEPLRVDLALVRGAASALFADPLESLRRYVPREVVDEVSYATAVALVECERPPGTLLLFGGPHQFFHRAWEGDSCGVFIGGDGRARVEDNPAKALAIEEGGRRALFSGERLKVELRFERARSRRDLHGAGRFLGDGKLGRWAPGLGVERGLHRLVSGRAELDGEELRLGWGWMYLERGRGRLLRWPLGATWAYASWLFPSGECGSGVNAVPMLASPAATWWQRFLTEAVDGAAALSPEGDSVPDYEPAVDPGPPVRVVRDSARAGETELRYRVLSAAVVPFDEDGQVIFRLRCLCGAGAGLVEIPASFPGLSLEAQGCSVAFSEDAVSLRVGGRELLSLPTDGGQFLSPYEPPAPGILRRAARATRRLLGQK